MLFLLCKLLRRRVIFQRKYYDINLLFFFADEAFRQQRHLYEPEELKWSRTPASTRKKKSARSPRPPVRIPPQPQIQNQNQMPGPIYEDIDRMCSYRGYPPDFLRPSQNTSSENNR